ncbi:suppressor of fused domain protein [Streptomyces ehimensis]|uniref:Suppressor of fused domain protein n=1 Tax=Streptomyces ehimensis TaxID=68195 RepID=A0ABV9BWL7_9ACTN
MSDARVLAAKAVEAHVRAFFEGHSVEVVDYDLGPERREVAPDLRVLVVGPGPRGDSWAYVTAGCWTAVEKDGHSLEFVMTARFRDQRSIELMAMIAYYHCAGHQLDLEHSVPIGDPWVPGSTCDHLLLSLPYLHGPDLELRRPYRSDVSDARWACDPAPHPAGRNGGREPGHDGGGGLHQLV